MDLNEPPDLLDEIDADDLDAGPSDPVVAVRPWLPPATELEVPDLGMIPVRELPGPPGAPTVVLLHGWTATADLNFFRCYEALGEYYRVVAFDHRGHGTGLRTRKTFRLADCADDAVAVADALGVERFVPVGYSMGGTIAQLTWRRHPDRVAGLVLCATAARFADRREDRLPFLGLTGLAALARVTPSQARDWITEQLYLQRKTELWDPWAVEQAATHDWRMVLEAGRALGTYSAMDWLGEIDVPTALVLTMRDRVIPIQRQRELFERIGHAYVYRVDADHDAAVSTPERFVPALLRALRAVTS